MKRCGGQKNPIKAGNTSSTATFQKFCVVVGHLSTSRWKTISDAQFLKEGDDVVVYPADHGQPKDRSSFVDAGPSHV